MQSDTRENDTRQIALGLRRGDVIVLEALVEQYQYRLVRYLIYMLGRRDGVDDLVQETWLRVLERGGSYDGHSRFEPWLFRIARNMALDAMRKRPMFSLNSTDDGGVRPAPASDKPSPFTLAARTEDAGGWLARCKPWSLSIAKFLCCAFKRTYRCRRYPLLWERRSLPSLQEFIEGWQRCGRSSREKQHEPPRKLPAHDRREPGRRHPG
jgi:RNA polymerase sigma factor (sigma-70 family)